MADALRACGLPAADANTVADAMLDADVSASNFMAPWGGAEPLLGTNPIAVAIPAGKEAPIMLDIATSVASNGAIRTYANEGRPLPVGWVISREDGQPITDGKRLNEACS